MNHPPNSWLTPKSTDNPRWSQWRLNGMAQLQCFFVEMNNPQCHVDRKSEAT